MLKAFGYYCALMGVSFVVLVAGYIILAFTHNEALHVGINTGSLIWGCAFWGGIIFWIVYFFLRFGKRF